MSASSGAVLAEWLLTFSQTLSLVYVCVCLQGKDFANPHLDPNKFPSSVVVCLSVRAPHYVRVGPASATACWSALMRILIMENG